MTTLVHTIDLHDTEGFDLESADGAIGRIEEIWLGPNEEPQALAIRMTDGSRALLLDEEVVAVDREHHWVIVGPHPELLELDAPRLESTGGRPAASWATTGAVIHPEPLSTAGVLQAFRRRVPSMDERPLWQLVATLYAAVALIVVFVVALVFVVSWIAAGHAYQELSEIGLHLATGAERGAQGAVVSVPVTALVGRPTEVIPMPPTEPLPPLVPEPGPVPSDPPGPVIVPEPEPVPHEPPGPVIVPEPQPPA